MKRQKDTGRVNGDSVLRVIAVLVLWIAPLPAAFFVGRSVYWHLIYGWHLDLGILGVAAAVVAGAMIELVGILSAHVALACHRWNGHGNVRKKDRPWERAPFWAAAVCFVIYAGVAIALAVVLEALPELAIYAPALVTAIAADAYVALGIYEQHRDRLTRYGLQWNWKPTQEPVAEAQPDLQPVQFSQRLVQQGRALGVYPQVQDFRSKAEHVRWLHEHQPGLTVTELAQEARCHVSSASRAIGKNGRNHDG